MTWRPLQNESGIQWRVIVICHLSCRRVHQCATEDNTIILTAAAADRKLAQIESPN